VLKDHVNVLISKITVINALKEELEIPAANMLVKEIAEIKLEKDF